MTLAESHSALTWARVFVATALVAGPGALASPETTAPAFFASAASFFTSARGVVDDAFLGMTCWHSPETI